MCASSDGLLYCVTIFTTSNVKLFTNSLYNDLYPLTTWRPRSVEGLIRKTIDRQNTVWSLLHLFYAHPALIMLKVSGNRKRKLPTTVPDLTIEPPKFIRKRVPRDSCTSAEQHFLAAQKATDLTISTCRGYLAGEGVIVSDPQDIDALLKLGNYGKGVFSRSVPCHGQLASFKLPSKSDRRKKRVSDDENNESVPLSSELTPIEQDLLQKMSQFVEVQEKRTLLHAEWSREAIQDETKTSPTSSPMELSPINTTSQTGLELHLQENTSGVPSDKILHSTTLSQKSTDKVGPDGVETPSLQLEPFKHLEKRMRFLSETDQYKLLEYVQLSSEEAFYLSYKLNILNVISDNCKRTLSVDELWDRLSSDNSNFIARYVAYCYYREKGWVPKSGLKFGVDFVLYKQGPMTYHSSYTVIVRMVSEEETQVGKQDTKPPEVRTATISTRLNSKTGLTWRDVIALDRVSKSVVKDLIVCYIVKQQHFPDKDWKQFPGCLERLRVSEVFVKQWQPDREREAS